MESIEYHFDCIIETFNKMYDLPAEQFIIKKLHDSKVEHMIAYEELEKAERFQILTIDSIKE